MIMDINLSLFTQTKRQIDTVIVELATRVRTCFGGVSGPEVDCYSAYLSQNIGEDITENDLRELSETLNYLLDSNLVFAVGVSLDGRNITAKILNYTEENE